MNPSRLGWHSARLSLLCCPLALAGILNASQAAAQTATAGSGNATKADTVAVSLAGGKLMVDAPAGWESVKPRNRIIEKEFAIAGDTPDTPAGRLTVTVSGGSIDANLARWKGQFRNLVGEAKIENDTASGMKLTLFDAQGTFLDSPRGPFGPKVEKPDYRMLAGILQTGDAGNYFFKLTGPADLVEKHAAAFRAMAASAKRAKP